jgi:hypothetical protein
MAGDLQVDSIANAAGTGGTTVYLGGVAAANLLDDYEEGSFTPVISSDGTPPTVTYVSQAGTYTIVGNRITMDVKLRVTITAAGTGNIKITGLPYATTGGSCSINLSQLFPTLEYYRGYTSGTEYIMQKAGGTAIPVGDMSLTASRYFQFTITGVV